MAAFTPTEGANCTSFRVRLGDGSWLPALAEAPGWGALTARPSFYGNPLLFPFAYGLAGGRLRYRGREHRLRPTRWERVAHGLVRDAAWTVEGAWEDAAGAHLQVALDTAGHPEHLAEYPFPFRVRVAYTLSGGGLTLEATAHNPGPEAMPFGFGIHPYVPAPLGGLGQPGPPGAPGGPYDDLVWCDATHVDASGPHPAGASPAAPPPAEGVFDLRPGRTFGDLLAAQRARRDRGGLFLTCAKRPQNGHSTPGGQSPPDGQRTLDGQGLPDGPGSSAGEGLRWSFRSPRLGATVEIETSPELWAMVLFAPPEPTPVISPVIGTCLPGFLDVPPDSDLARALGYRELAPGATWSARATLRVTQ